MIDLYTVYLYNYAREYLFQTTKDIIKMKSFSNNASVIFIDKFDGLQIIGFSALEFFDYLKSRDCFKIEMSLRHGEQLLLECSCRFSKEYWHGKVILDDDEYVFDRYFEKIGEELWVSHYRELSEDEIIEERRKLKKRRYRDN
ncbi:MAG: hypothetical protein ACRC7N_01025 [Clostridium sp.]